LSKKTKLELTWIVKDERPRLEPRILLEDTGLSYHATRRVSEGDEFDNRVIFGDNLLALKALEAEFTGKVKLHLHRPAVQHGLGVHALRRRAGTFVVVKINARQVGDVETFVSFRRLVVDYAG
jgi:hypothetical protein